ncbi:ABC transporter substrate-binding protein [Rhodopila sp.]|uniref:ABC transporter substrate-binding protein n=1 Tax=Rhodopila sp. TaxID=2480087 RepID=UPI002C675140|nr:ABC transporter substrate-binding protein [Rhodopila sp.]HVZ06287.1 ABC transporter substrate-binding protein [Rhodopila sp.]
MRFRSWFAAAALLLSSFAAHAAEPIKIGMLFPQSGGAGDDGQRVTKAVQVMAELINAQGGVLGRPIQVLIRDDESTPAVGVAKANELIGEGVSLVIEGYNSPVTLAIQPVLARAGIMDITVLSKADGILANNNNPLAVRMNSSNAMDAAAIADWLMHSKAHRIAFATQNDAYGNGAQAGVEAELKKAGWPYEIVSQQSFPFTATDFRVAVTAIKDAKPDAVSVTNSSGGSGMPAFLQQYAQQRGGAPVVAAVGTISPTVLAIAGAAAEGVASADIYFADVEPFKSYKANQDFVAALRTNHLLADKFTALGGGALQVWAIAANQVKSLDKEKVANAIRGKTLPGTIFGDATFAPNGQMQAHFFTTTVKDGQIVVQQ